MIGSFVLTLMKSHEGQTSRYLLSKKNPVSYQAPQPTEAPQKAE